MSTYPTALMEQVRDLRETVPQAELNDNGLFVVAGLNLPLAQQLVDNSNQPHIGRTCPNDAPKRFKDVPAVESWQTKQRLSLPLVRELGPSFLDLSGFGWMGPGSPDVEAGEPEIPGAVVTFAVRLYESALKQGNAPHYTRAILDAHEAIIGNNQGVWLEAWKTNKRAIEAYEDNGFITVAEIPGILHGEEVTRVYMTLGQLSAAA